MLRDEWTFEYKSRAWSGNPRREQRRRGIAAIAAARDRSAPGAELRRHVHLTGWI